MSDSVGRPLLTLAMFVCLLALVLGSMSGIFTNNATGATQQKALEGKFSLETLMTNDFFTPYSQEAENITPSVFISFFPVHQKVYNGHPITFSLPGDADINVFMLLLPTPYVDMILHKIVVPYGFVLYQEWGWWDSRYCTISPKQIFDGYDNGTQTVTVNCKLKLDYKLTIHFDNGTNWKNDYKMGKNYSFNIYVDKFDESQAQTSAWNMMTGIMSFNVPFVENIYIKIVVSTFFWTVCAFLAVRVLIGIWGGMI
jgi:hypothetical protein